MKNIFDSAPASAISSSDVSNDLSLDVVQTVSKLQFEPKEAARLAQSASRSSNRFTLDPLTHQQIVARVTDKQNQVLVFLASGEIWTTKNILSHLLKLGERQTQATISKMVDERLLKVEVMPDGLRIYGITNTGLAQIDMAGKCKSFELGRTPQSTVKHHLLSQKVRLSQDMQTSDQWIPGKAIPKFPSNFKLKKVPDGLLLLNRVVPHRNGNNEYSQMRELIYSFEVELNTKSIKRMRSIVEKYEDDLGETSDPYSYFHRVYYYTTKVNTVTKLIDKLASKEHRNKFFVVGLDKDIRPYKRLENGSDDQLIFD